MQSYFLSSFLQLWDKAMPCYEKITDSAFTDAPHDDAVLGEYKSDTRVPMHTIGHHSNDGDKQQGSQAQEPDLCADSLHLKPLFSEILAEISDNGKRAQIVLAIEHHDKLMDGAVCVERGERMVRKARLL